MNLLHRNYNAAGAVAKRITMTSEAGIRPDNEGANIREALQAVRLFSDSLRHDQLDDLALECVPLSFPAGAVLIRQGEFGSSMFCITQGAVSVTYASPLHRKRQIRRLEAGSVVGEIELLTGERRLATVTALTDLSVLQISKKALDRLFAKTPELLESFTASLAIRRAMFDQIVRDRGESLAVRMARRIQGIFGGA